MEIRPIDNKIIVKKTSEINRLQDREQFLNENEEFKRLLVKDDENTKREKHKEEKEDKEENMNSKKIENKVKNKKLKDVKLSMFDIKI